MFRTLQNSERKLTFKQIMKTSISMSQFKQTQFKFFQPHKMAQTAQ